MNAAVYARQSKTDQNAEKVSINQQIDDAQKLAKKEGLKVVHIFKDEDRSGALPPIQWRKGRQKYREGLSDLLNAIEAGEVQAVICRKVDRLTRAKLELALKLFGILQDKKVKVYCTHESNPEYSTSTGELQLNILLAFASFERKKISDNVKAAKDYLKRNGKKYTNCTTFGYENGPNKDVVVNEEEAAIVKKIFDQVAGGASYWAITHWLRKDHGDLKKWHPQIIKTILKNPQYIGKRRSGDGFEPNELYAQIVDETIFYNVQNIMSKKKGGREFHGRKYLLSGLLVCAECGEKLHVIPIARTGHKTYVCRSKHQKKPPQIRLEYWDGFAADVLANTTLEVAKTAPKVDFERSSIELNMSKTKELFAEGLIDADELREILKKGKAKLASLKNEVSTTDSSIEWESATDEQKRHHLFSSVSKIEVSKESVLVKFNANYRPNLPLFKVVKELEFRIIKEVGKAGKMRNAIEYTKLLRDGRISEVIEGMATKE